MDNNEMLAACYDPDFRQMIIIWPNTWVHDPGGDWHIAHRFKEEHWREPPVNVADFTRYG